MSQDNKAKIVYLNEKGYGFLKAEGYQQNIFFHASSCREFHFSDLKVGELVAFNGVSETAKGLTVEDVMPIQQ